MENINTLLDTTAGALGQIVLPEELKILYGGDLRFPALDVRPYVIGNFVSTIDGVVSFEIPGKSGGGDISGFNEADRFIMGLLRASVDAVVVGAGTFEKSPLDICGWLNTCIQRGASAMRDTAKGCLTN